MLYFPLKINPKRSSMVYNINNPETTLSVSRGARRGSFCGHTQTGADIGLLLRGETKGRYDQGRSGDASPHQKNNLRWSNIEEGYSSQVYCNALLN